MIPEKWKDYSLEEVASFKSGKTRPLTEGPYPVYGGNGILGFADNYNSESEVIIIGRVGAYCGSVFYEDKPLWISDNALMTLPRNSNDGKFLFYLFKLLNLHRYAQGSSHPLLTQTILNDIHVTIPIDSNEQCLIASILSSLDDKIELNLQMNKTLEAIAQAIFKEWFVDFRFPGFDGVLVDGLPKGWRKGTVGEEFLLIMGQSPPGESYNDIGEGTIFFQGRTDFGFRFPENRMYTTSPNRLAKKLDTLVSVRAPVGDINMALEDCCIGRGLSSVRHKSGAYSYSYYAMKSLEPTFKGFDGEGTIFGSINKSNFENISTVAPDAKIIMEFEIVVNTLDDKIINNSVEIKTLTQIRDYLLPRLMTGKIKVA